MIFQKSFKSSTILEPKSGASNSSDLVKKRISLPLFAKLKKQSSWLLKKVWRRSLRPGEIIVFALLKCSAHKMARITLSPKNWVRRLILSTN